MKKLFAPAALMTLTLLNCGVVLAESTEDTIQREIDKSIAAYPYECPCPYSKTKAGELCGNNSAYNNSADYIPFCYPEDVIMPGEKLDDLPKTHSPGKAHFPVKKPGDKFT